MAQVQALETLKNTLSPEASIDVFGGEGYAAAAARWSDLHTPKSAAVVTVASEEDVVATVKWATAHNVPFIAQSGGHAWGNWYSCLGRSGVVINMRKLNSVDVDAAQGVAVIGGGAIVKEVLVAAKKARVHVMIGTCNSVGAIPSITGGGLGPLMGLYGCGADNMVSARIVTPDGVLRTVSADSDPDGRDLWWALRGAAPNFGVVTSLTVRAHAELNGGAHYSAMLAFPGGGWGRVEAVVRAATARVKVAEDTAVTVLFMRTPPPDSSPTVAVQLWHAGPTEEARARFAPLFDEAALGGLPVVVLAEDQVPYDRLNDGLDVFCFKGGYKPGWACSVDEVPLGGSSSALRRVWDDWLAFSGREGCGLSVVSLERYSTGRARAAAPGGDAVGPAVRERKLHAFFCAIYGGDDPALHEAARAVGEEFRRLIGGGTGKSQVYINFSSGDEDIEQLYGSGERFERLRALKRKWDPNGVFSHFIPIQ